MFLVGNLAVTSLAESCPLLTRIDLSFCPLVTDLGVRTLWQRSTHLREIRIVYNRGLTSDAFLSDSLLSRSGHKGLSNIDPFSSSPPPTASSIETEGVLPSLTSRHPFDHVQLLALDLSWYSLLTDDTMESIILHAPNIQCLTLDHCPLLTGRTVETICKLGKSLQSLHLGPSNEIMDGSVRSLARSCIALQSLHIGSCPYSSPPLFFFLSRMLIFLFVWFS